MNTKAPSDSSGGIRVVNEIDDLLECVRQFPRDLILLRETTPPSEERLRNYALRIGGIFAARGFGQIRQIRYEPSIANSTALSLRPLPFHTDGSFLSQPPPRFMLSCISADAGGGGLSTFYPVDDLVQVLPNWAEEAFRTADFLFPQTYDGDLTNSCVAPILTTGADGSIHIRWRSDDLFRPEVVNSRGTRAVDAVNWLHEHLEGTQRVTYLAKPGETILVANEAVLHGRTALTPESCRLMLRVWLA